MTFFHTWNSDLPNNCVRAVAVDQNGTKWVGTEEGLVSIDGQGNWGGDWGPAALRP